MLRDASLKERIGGRNPGGVTAIKGARIIVFYKHALERQSFVACMDQLIWIGERRSNMERLQDWMVASGAIKKRNFPFSHYRKGIWLRDLLTLIVPISSNISHHSHLKVPWQTDVTRIWVAEPHKGEGVPRGARRQHE
jgi:pterin-4a-carbinolamine dehydratase